LRWAFPLWVPDEGVDTTLLKGRLKPSEERENDKDREGVNKIVDAIRKDGPATARQLRPRSGLSRERLERLLHKLRSEDQLQVTQITIRGNLCDEYALPKEQPPTSND
jgi:predicted HTH transcriptional regulator